MDDLNANTFFKIMNQHVFDSERHFDEILRYYDTYGFVCVSNLLTTTECDTFVDAYWKNVQVDPYNNHSLDSFLKSQRFRKVGIMGSCSTITQETITLREHPRVLEFFRKFYDDNDLIVDHDRVGILAPMLDMNNVILPNESVLARKTHSNWLHIDCNPISHTNHTNDDECRGFASISTFQDNGESINFLTDKIPQSSLAMTDSDFDTGGFYCVPRSHLKSIHWAKNQLHKSHNLNMYGEMDDRFLQLNPDDSDDLLFSSMAVKIPVPKGSMLLWNPLLFHCNYPNRSNRFRIVHYMRVFQRNNQSFSPLLPSVINVFRVSTPSVFA